MHTNHADRKKTGTTLNDFDIHAHTTFQVILAMNGHLDEGLFLILVILQPGHVGYGQQVFTELPGVEQGFGGGYHVEWDRQGTPLVHVIQPQLGPGKLPLHVTVSLHQSKYKYLTRDLLDMISFCDCIPSSYSRQSEVLKCFIPDTTQFASVDTNIRNQTTIVRVFLVSFEIHTYFHCLSNSSINIREYFSRC